MSCKHFIALLGLALSLGAAEIPAANLLKCGDFESPDTAKAWRSGWWVWQKGSKDQAHRTKIGKMTQRTLEKGAGQDKSTALRLHSPLDIQKELNSQGDPMLASTYGQAIAIADSGKAAKYLLTFDVKGETCKLKNLNSLQLFVEFSNSVKKSTREGINQTVTVKKDWEKRGFTFTVPAHTVKLDVRFALYGLGDLYIDNVVLQDAATVKTPVKAMDLK